MSNDPAKRRPVVLCILDGWGLSDEVEANAIVLGKTPNWDRLISTCPNARLSASALDVGLPGGQMGNSEVGHMNLGAGRVVMQDLPRIDAAIVDGSLNTNPVLQEMCAALKASGGTCHLMGLLSPGGVHSMQDHMVVLARILAEHNIPVAIHALLDGRDTPPSSAHGYMQAFLNDIAGLAGVRMATVSGRYWGMDRDKRWERVEKAYAAMTRAEGAQFPDPLEAIQASYDAGRTDEFMLPAIIGGYGGMKDGDALLMANFRSDRVREILTALVDPGFDGFERPDMLDFAARIGMTEYSRDLNAYFQALFAAERPENILGALVSDAGMTQLRTAETEKYAHVTFFFNGGQERVFPGEERILVNSPKVATYDLQPEMSAREVTDGLVEAIGSGRFDLIIVNYANGDMVGHTGVLGAAIQATEVLDEAIGRLEAAVRGAGGVLLITADHGNCEQMIDPDTGQPHTAHTLNPVPLVLVNAPPGISRLQDGILADVAPTLLDMLGLEKPHQMTGHSLTG